MHIEPEREDLSQTIPVRTPYSFLIESTNLCNFACHFCPSSITAERKRVGWERGHMEPMLFAKIVDDLGEFPDKIKKMHYHFMGEPLLNPYFFSNVRYAVNAGVSDVHWVRTNGYLLSPEKNSELTTCGLTQIGLSIEAVSAEGYKKLSGVSLDYDRFIRNIKDLHRKAQRNGVKLYAKIIDFGIPETDPVRFRELYEPICDFVEIEYPMQWNNGCQDTTMGDGVQQSVNGDPLNIKRVCPYPFFTMAINWRGFAVMCCFDWSYQTIVGNVNQQSVKQIWEGKLVRDFWRMHLSGHRDASPACRDCQNIYACPDNIDGEADALLKKLARG